MRVLMLPLFRFPTGHTKAAEAIIDAIEKVDSTVQIDTVDLLSYTNATMEKGIGTFYIKWIHSSPKSYQLMYEKIVNNKKPKTTKETPPFFAKFFLRKMKQLVAQYNPDLIICTHAFPSSILGMLKRDNAIKNVPVVNAYTDFFMNDVWAKNTSEYHLAPHQEAKQQLIQTFGREASRIFVTGVPIHAGITTTPATPQSHHVLLAGGNIGFMDVQALIDLTALLPDTTFTVLCGSNKKLYQKIKQANRASLIPKGYITSRSEMNALYESTSAMVTKPGGVTMTEVMRKRIPIFIDHFLPGPEEENFHYLNARGMVRKLNEHKLQELTDPTIIAQMSEAIQQYEEELDYSLEEAIQAIFADLAQ